MKYIVRANNYNYNDENNYIESAGAIEDIYDSREEAIETRNQLNVDEIDGYNRLNDFIYHSENEEENRIWLRKYYHDNFRIILDEADECLDDDVCIPETATDEQILTILNKLGIRFYEVYEYDNVSPMVELQPNLQFWGDETYSFTECGRSFYFSEDEAFKYLKGLLENALYAGAPGLSGTIEQLSDTPEILTAFIENSQSLAYSKENGAIKLKENYYDSIDTTELKGLFNLLKTQPYHVVLFSIEDAQKLAGQQPEAKPAPAPGTTIPHNSDKKWWEFWK